MKNLTLILTLFLLFGVYELKSQNTSVPSYEKKIYSLKYERIKSDIAFFYYYNDCGILQSANNSDIDVPISSEITITAKSSSEFTIKLESTRRSFSSYDKIILSFNNIYFQNYVNAMKKYLDWYKIVEKNNVNLTKDIDSINVDNNNTTCRASTGAFSFTEINLSKIIFKCVNNIFIIKVIGYSDSYYFDSYMGKNIYDGKKIPEGRSIAYDKCQIEKIYSLLSGVNFENLKIEIDQKIKLWEQFK